MPAYAPNSLPIMGKSATGPEAGEGVPKIVQANPIESGALRHSLPWTFQIGKGEFNMISWLIWLFPSNFFHCFSLCGEPLELLEQLPGGGAALSVSDFRRVHRTEGVRELRLYFRESFQRLRPRSRKSLSHARGLLAAA